MKPILIMNIFKLVVLAFLFIFTSSFAQQKIIINDKVLESFSNKNYSFDGGSDQIFKMKKDDESHFTYKEIGINFNDLSGHTIQLFTLKDKYIRVQFERRGVEAVTEYEEVDHYGIFDETSNSYYYVRDSNFNPNILIYDQDAETEKSVEAFQKLGYIVTKEDSQYFVHSKYFKFPLTSSLYKDLILNKNFLKQYDLQVEKYMAAEKSIPKLTTDLHNFYSQYRVYRKNIPQSSYKAWITVTKRAQQTNKILVDNNDIVALALQQKGSKAYKILIEPDKYDQTNKFINILSQSRYILGL